MGKVFLDMLLHMGKTIPIMQSQEIAMKPPLESFALAAALVWCCVAIWSVM